MKMPSREPDWHAPRNRTVAAGELLSASESEQKKQGYFHTLREIRQQPSTLLATSDRMLRSEAELKRLAAGIQSLVLTGSGSSEYAGDCVRLPLQDELRIPVQTIASGSLLTHGDKVLPPARPGMMISIARSGDSPESAGALSLMLECEPDLRHLILTCNAKGQLAETFRRDPRVHVIVLDERTNDRSLVMTSSFTSLAWAARFLGLADQPEAYRNLSAQLSNIVQGVLQNYFETLGRVAARPFRRAVFLGSGSRFGAAREASLKMLEMTAGRVSTLCETYLGLRHGPMSYVHDDALIVCFLSSDEMIRAYEADLLRELDRKKLGCLKVIAGEQIPSDLLRKDDVAIECPGLQKIGDENAGMVDVVIGQLLGFFRCLEEGLQPDSPSESGVINRVVEKFQLHHPGARRA